MNTLGHWHAALKLAYAFEHSRSVLRYEHSGPLRILQSLYPEGPVVCHNILVHPPGGLVGGDVLSIQLEVAENAHALITTPGATRFYRSAHDQARQTVAAHLHHQSRLEWLPLETLAYNQCQGVNQAIFKLDTTAELLAWDMTALGLPDAQQPFVQGRLLQHLEIEGAWLERGLIDGEDKLLLDSPVGLAGYRCMGTLVLARGSAWPRASYETALESARQVITQTSQDVCAGVTLAHPGVIVLRTLSARVEPAQQLLRQVWSTWRQALWKLSHNQPRIWAM